MVKCNVYNFDKEKFQWLEVQHELIDINDYLAHIANPFDITFEEKVKLIQLIQSKAEIFDQKP